METVKLRREFDLPEEDVEHLDARGLPWETVTDVSHQWVLVHDFPTPNGYTTKTTTAGILVSPGYPTAQLDMVYFNPALSRVDGIAIPALCSVTIKGQPYQRWSRHRTGTNPWRPGLDNIATHLGLVEEWLQREFQQRPRR